MRVVLAPMEGVADAAMRHLLTQMGGYDFCVTEFIRVVDQTLPRKVFYRQCPELYHGGRTQSGTPVRVQLLGQHPQWLAENAVRAIEMGSYGVDLNFGCPSKQVNGHHGGAVLLKTPDQIYQIIKTVRQAIPGEACLSAKIRLGWENRQDCVHIVEAMDSAGVDEITVHARTKVDGYRPPAHWQYINKLRLISQAPIIANGEIWSYQDCFACQQTSGVEDVMLGRGALTIPNLAQVVRGQQEPLAWPAVEQLIRTFTEYELSGQKATYFPSRIKQWLRYLSGYYPQAAVLFKQVRRYTDQASILSHLP